MMEGFSIQLEDGVLLGFEENVYDLIEYFLHIEFPNLSSTIDYSAVAADAMTENGYLIGDHSDHIEIDRASAEAIWIVRTKLEVLDG